MNGIQTKSKLVLVPDETALINEKGMFTLASPDMMLLQTYLTVGKCLPTEKEEFDKKYNLPQNLSEKEREEFEDLRKEFGVILRDTTFFSDVTYPNTVNTAGNIYHYGTKAKLYLSKMLLKYQNFLEGKITEEVAKNCMRAMADALIKDAKAYQEEALQIRQDILDFITKIQKSNHKLKDLKGSFESKFAKDERFQNYERLMDDITKEVEKENRNYTKNVLAASTSPTYAWVFPIGTIAATVVAGIYGAKATKVKQHIKNLENERDALRKEYKKKLDLLEDSRLAVSNIELLVKQAGGALVSLGKIAGVWDSLQSDLKDFKKTVETDVRDADIYLTDSGIEFAADSWNRLAQAADHYRKLAYVTMTSREKILEHESDFSGGFQEIVLEPELVEDGEEDPEKKIGDAKTGQMPEKQDAS